MRTFWLLVVALGILAAVLFASGRTAGPRANPPAPAPTAIEPAPEPSPEPASPAEPADRPARPGERADAEVLADLAAEATKPPPTASSAPTPAPVPATSASTPRDPANGPAEAAVPAPRGPEGATNAGPATGPAGEPITLPRHADFPSERTVPSTARVRPDGALVIDDRFLVRGKGTKDDPYRITWEHLVSAEDVYKPRLGQKRLPERVTFLHNTYVRLTGFVAFPITSSNPRECLVMLNQWDGCCIGVPPTAYDAVEVKLAKPATGNDRLAEHGTLEGRFRVDPYEEGGWLLGLYLMDDATLKPDL